MKTNREIRAEAWKIVRGGKWFWRIFTAGVILYSIIIMVSVTIGSAYSSMGIETWTNFIAESARSMQAGGGCSLPSMSSMRSMTRATAFEQFVGYIFGAILVFGMAGLMLKAVKDVDERWLAGTFDGFRRPLEVAWLMILMNLKVFLWSLLFFFPGWVAVYRYRQAWYLKSENPDWSAAKCIGESGMMMKGHKWQAFSLDMTFLGWLFLAWVVFVAGATMGVVGRASSPLMMAVSAILSLVGIYFSAFVLAYFFVARAIFYRELPCAPARDMV